MGQLILARWQLPPPRRMQSWKGPAEAKVDLGLWARGPRILGLASGFLMPWSFRLQEALILRAWWMLQEGSGGPSEGWGPTLSPHMSGSRGDIILVFTARDAPRNSG